MKNDARLERNPDVRLDGGPGVPAFVHASGSRVETDRLGRLVWEALPARPSEIAAAIEADLAAPRHALDVFIEVLRASGIARFEGEGSTPPLMYGDDGTALPAEPALVSVIITTHNGMANIDDCFRSLGRQTYPNIEILVVDNASTDGTVERIRSEYPRVNVHALERNIHYARSVNYGVSRAKGEFLFILNDDVELDPDCVSRLVRRAVSSPAIGAVVPMMRLFYLRGILNGIGNEVWDRGWGTDIFFGHVDVGQFGGIDEVPSACFGAVFVRRSAFEDTGPLDRSYGTFYEDVDWSFRCRFRGWKIVAAPGAVVYHKFGATYLGPRKLRFVVRNRQRLALKLFQGRVRLGFVRRYFAEDLKSFLAQVKGRQWRAANGYLLAYASLALQGPSTFFKRRKVMRQRKKGVRELDVFRLNIAFYCATSPSGHPRIDSSTLLGYYRWKAR